MQEATDTNVPTRLQHIQSSRDVGRHVAAGCIIRIGYADQGSQVKHVAWLAAGVRIGAMSQGTRFKCMYRVSDATR